MVKVVNQGNARRDALACRGGIDFIVGMLFVQQRRRMDVGCVLGVLRWMVSLLIPKAGAKAAPV